MFYCIIALAISSTFAAAQVRVGVTGGVQLANQPVKFSGITLTSDRLIEYHAGLLLDAPLAGNLSLRPQLLYSVKGGKYDLGSFSGGIINDLKTTINYLEIPIQLMYGLVAGPGQVKIGAGPYVGYAINGKTSGSSNGQSGSEAIEFGSGEDQTKQLDYGLRLSAGYELTSGLGVTAFYAPGLANLANTSQGSVKNISFGLSLSYLFGGE